MEEVIILLLPALLSIFLVRALLLPLGTVFKLTIHSACGFACLWLLNSISQFTGIYFSMNAVTVLIAGIAGLPGIGILAILAVLA